LEPAARVHDVPVRITRFVAEHRGTFFSLVRGVASGDPEVRAIVDGAREANAEHLREALVQQGEVDSPAMRLGLRSWVAFAEETFVALASRSAEPEAEVATDTAEGLIAFLEDTLTGVVTAARDARI